MTGDIKEHGNYTPDIPLDEESAKTHVLIVIGGLLASLIMLASIVLMVLATFKVSQAVDTYDIASKGTILDFKAFDSAGTEYNPSHLPIDFMFFFATRLQITGEIDHLESLKAGDEITIGIASAAGSTYRLISAGDYAVNLDDSDGVTQFTVSTDETTITLTKTPNIGAGSLAFQLNSALDNIARINSGISSTNNSSSWYPVGYENLAVTFPNLSKNQVPLTGNSGDQIWQPSAGSLRMTIFHRLFSVYNQLISLVKAGQTDTEITNTLMSASSYGADFLTRNVIAVTRIEANPKITSVTGGEPYTFVYDLTDSGSSLISFYKDQSAQNNPELFQVSITADAEYSTTVSEMESLGVGAWGSVKNSDGSWTAAYNLGPLIDTDLLRYNDSVDISDYPNTTALNAQNQSLIDTARRIKLAAELSYTFFTVTVPTDEAVEVCATVRLPIWNYVSSRSCGTSRTASNIATGQTIVRVKYLDIADAASLADGDNYYGWPADNTLGEVPTPDQTVVVKEIENYQLVNDGVMLTDFAANNNLDLSQLLTSNTTIPFPSTGTTEVYYVYQQVAPATYRVDFEPNGAAPVDSQWVIENQTAIEPDKPVLTDHIFGGWYIDQELTLAYDFTTPVTNDITLYAKWLVACQYDATIMADEAACVEPILSVDDEPEQLIGLLPNVPNTGVWRFVFENLSLVLVAVASGLLVVVISLLRGWET